jgi:hypothetical protein
VSNGILFPSLYSSIFFIFSHKCYDNITTVKNGVIMAILKKIQSRKNTQKKTFRTPFSFDDPIEEKENPSQKDEHQVKTSKKKKRKHGRPKINKEDRRIVGVSAVLTEIESNKLCKLVKKSRLSKSEYIRRLILQAIDKQIYHL